MFNERSRILRMGSASLVAGTMLGLIAGVIASGAQGLPIPVDRVMDVIFLFFALIGFGVAEMIDRRAPSPPQ